MDRPLDDMIVERQRNGPRRRGGTRRDGPRDGVRKWDTRSTPRDLNEDWVHDRYEEDSTTRGPRSRQPDARQLDRYEPEHDDPHSTEALAKLRIENLHYDLTESDLRELFTRIGAVQSLAIIYDRSDRSSGVAYVTYYNARDARDAIREFDGANAYGQPIYLQQVPIGPSSQRGGNGGGGTRGRRGADDAQPRSTRSLFDRINDDSVPPRGDRRGRRSESPRAKPRTDYPMDRSPPAYIDRYVPGERDRSPRQRSNRSPRRPPPRARRGASPVRGRGGDRRGRGGRGAGTRKDADGHLLVGGRPRKTADELDAEMEDYWGGGGAKAGAQDAGNVGPSTKANGSSVELGGGPNVNANVGMGGGNLGVNIQDDGDVDMIE